MRVTLGLTDKELMKSSWISLQMQMYDFPYFDPKAKKTITGGEAEKALNKYMNK